MAKRKDQVARCSNEAQAIIEEPERGMWALTSQDMRDTYSDPSPVKAQLLNK
jgi:hypothetical protein